MMIRAMIADAGNDRDSVADYLAASKRFATRRAWRESPRQRSSWRRADMAGPSDLVAASIPNSERLVIDGVDHFEIRPTPSA